MLKKAEITKISKYLRWPEKDTIKAIKQLDGVETYIDLSDVVRVSCKVNDPGNRWLVLLESLLEETRKLLTKGNINIVELIVDLLQEDAPFKIVAFFNNREHGFINRYQTDTKSFIDWESALSPQYEISNGRIDNLKYLRFFGGLANNILLEKYFKNTFNDKGYTKYLPYLYSENLQYSFIEMLLLDYYEDGDIEDLMFKVVSEVGVLAFNIELFRNISRESWLNPILSKNKNSINEIFSSFNEYYKSNITKKTELKYWLYYTTVAKLREIKGLGYRESIRKLAELEYSSYYTIHSRYYKMKRIAKKREMNVDEIIRMYKLDRKVKDILATIQ